MKKYLLEKLLMSIINSTISSLLEDKDNKDTYNKYTTKLQLIISFVQSLLSALADKKLDKVEITDLKTKLHDIIK